jgi:hypothetical protein
VSPPRARGLERNVFFTAVFCAPRSAPKKINSPQRAEKNKQPAARRKK